MAVVAVWLHGGWIARRYRSWYLKNVVDLVLGNEPAPIDREEAPPPPVPTFKDRARKVSRWASRNKFAFTRRVRRLGRRLKRGPARLWRLIVGKKKAHPVPRHVARRRSTPVDINTLMSAAKPPKQSRTQLARTGDMDFTSGIRMDDERYSDLSGVARDVMLRDGGVAADNFAMVHTTTAAGKGRAGSVDPATGITIPDPVTMSPRAYRLAMAQWRAAQRRHNGAEDPFDTGGPLWDDEEDELEGAAGPRSSVVIHKTKNLHKYSVGSASVRSGESAHSRGSRGARRRQRLLAERQARAGSISNASPRFVAASRPSVASGVSVSSRVSGVSGVQRAHLPSQATERSAGEGSVVGSTAGSVRNITTRDKAQRLRAGTGQMSGKELMAMAASSFSKPRK